MYYQEIKNVRVKQTHNQFIWGCFFQKKCKIDTRLN